MHRDRKLGEEGQKVLVDWVEENLRHGIVEGRFLPGERLSQEELAASLGVSLTPLRDAIRRLEFQGFVDVRPRRGVFIPKLNREDIQKTFELRRILETEVVRQVTPLIPGEVLEQLERSISETHSSYASGNAIKHFETDVLFHNTLIDYCRNELIVETLRSLHNRITTVRRLAQTRSGPHLEIGLDEHKAVLHAVRQRDAEEAARLMAEHLNRSAARLMSLVEPDAMPGMIPARDTDGEEVKQTT